MENNLEVSTFGKVKLRDLCDSDDEEKLLNGIVKSVYSNDLANLMTYINLNPEQFLNLFTKILKVVI